MRSMTAFLKERKRAACLYIIFAGTYAVISYLYNIRMDAVRYAFVLSMVWLTLFGLVDYVQYVRKHKELLEMGLRLESGLGSMPDAATMIEEDYQRIVVKLYEAKVDLESADRIGRQEMVDYYSMWVHQIKTPIAAMHVLLQAAESCQLGEGEASGARHSLDDDDGAYENSQYIREMKLELFKIEQYAEMVLTYLRMEGMSDLSFEIYSLDMIIKQAVRKYSQMFILKKVRLKYTPIEVKVLTDEKWLLFVLEQILSNALKYTSSDKNRKSENAKAAEDVEKKETCGIISIYMKGGNLVIEDNGIGIWPEDLPRVFERGFTGYNGRTDKKSTGIGLYLCKSIMDKLRHQIWIESEVGKGTRVYLSLARKTVRHE